MLPWLPNDLRTVNITIIFRSEINYKPASTTVHIQQMDLFILQLDFYAKMTLELKRLVSIQSASEPAYSLAVWSALGVGRCMRVCLNKTKPATCFSGGR